MRGARYGDGVKATRLPFLIGSYAVLTWLAYVFLRPQVAPCLGLGDNTACYEAWAADPLVALSLSPVSWLALFAVPSVLTIMLWARRRPRDK